MYAVCLWNLGYVSQAMYYYYFVYALTNVCDAGVLSVCSWVCVCACVCSWVCSPPIYLSVELPGFNSTCLQNYRSMPDLDFHFFFMDN